jgi:hypothetical protein
MISSPNMVFLVVLEFELRPCTYWASTVPLKPCPNPKKCDFELGFCYM